MTERPYHSVSHIAEEELERLKQECLTLGENYRDSEAFEKGYELLCSVIDEGVSDIPYDYFTFFGFEE